MSVSESSTILLAKLVNVWYLKLNRFNLHDAFLQKAVKYNISMIIKQYRLVFQ